MNGIVATVHFDPLDAHRFCIVACLRCEGEIMGRGGGLGCPGVDCQEHAEGEAGVGVRAGERGKSGLKEGELDLAPVRVVSFSMSVLRRLPEGFCSGNTYC